MPALPPAGDVVRIDVGLEVGTDAHAINRFHWAYSGSHPDPADCESIGNQVATAWNAHLRAFMTENSAQSTVDVVDLSSLLGAGGLIVNNAVGTRAGASIPAASAVLVNHKISRRYRGGKPRSYLPLFVASDLNGPSGWLSASVTALQTAYDAWAAEISGFTAGSTLLGSQVAVSYFLNNALRATPLVEPITASVVNGAPASQRRRQTR